jgi:multidrug efflux system outer membrane protein
LFPSVKLTGHLGDASTTLNNLFSASASFWMLLAGLDMPVFDMSTLAKIDKAEAQYQKSLKQYMQTVKRSFADVENALSKNKRYRQRMHSRDQAVQYAKDQIDIQKIKLKSGASRPSELLLTQLNRNQALAQYNQAKIKKMQTLVGVYKALGAGSEVSMKNAKDQ